MTTVRKLVVLCIIVLVVMAGSVWAEGSTEATSATPTTATTSEAAAVPAVPEWTAVGWIDFVQGQDPLSVLDVYDAKGWELLFINFPVGAKQTSYREVAVGKTWPIAMDDKGVILAGAYADYWLFCDQTYGVGRLIVDRQVGNGWRIFLDNVLYVPVSGEGLWAFYAPQDTFTHQLDGKLTGGLAVTAWDAEGIAGGDFLRIGPMLQYDLGGGKSISAMWWKDVANGQLDAIRIRCDVPF